MNERLIGYITVPLATVLIIGIVSGSIIYDNHLDASKTISAIKAGCSVTEKSSISTYDCGNINDSKIPQK